MNQQIFEKELWRLSRLPKAAVQTLYLSLLASYKLRFLSENPQLAQAKFEFIRSSMLKSHNSNSTDENPMLLSYMIFLISLAWGTSSLSKNSDKRNIQWENAFEYSLEDWLSIVPLIPSPALEYFGLANCTHLIGDFFSKSSDNHFSEFFDQKSTSGEVKKTVPLKETSIFSSVNSHKDLADVFASWLDTLLKERENLASTLSSKIQEGVLFKIPETFERFEREAFYSPKYTLRSLKKSGRFLKTSNNEVLHKKALSKNQDAILLAQ